MYNHIEIFTYHECAAEARLANNGDPEFDMAPPAWLLFNRHLKSTLFCSKSKKLQQDRWCWDRTGRHYHSEWQGSRCHPGGCFRDEAPIWSKFSFGGEASTDMGYPLRKIFLHEYPGLPGQYKAYVQSLGEDPRRLCAHAHMTKMSKERHLDMWAHVLLEVMMSPPYISSDWYRHHHDKRFPSVPL